MKTLGWVVGGLVLGLIIHIVSVLILPSLAENNAWSRLSRFGGFNTLHILPPATPQIEAIPDMDPSLRYAICRYDLETGPLKIVTTIPRYYWSLAIYDQSGGNYFTLNNRSAGRETLTLWIADQRQILAMEPDGQEDVEERLIVKSNGRYGIAMLRILVAGPSHETFARSILANSTCAIDNSTIFPPE